MIPSARETTPKITKAMMLLREGEKDLDKPFIPTSPIKKNEIPLNRVQQMIKEKEKENDRNSAEQNTTSMPTFAGSVKKNVFVVNNDPVLESKLNEKLSKSEIDRMGGITKSMSNSPSIKNINKLRKIQMSISSNDLTLKKTRNFTPKTAKLNNIKAKRIVTAKSVNNWMDTDQINLKISSFVCRMIEIKQWIELILKIDIGLDDSNIHEFPDYLTNGILICKLAQHFDPSIKKVYTGGKTDSNAVEYKMITKRYNYIDNINEFINFAHNIKLPNLFIFETNDLYMKKNIPKVIACLHALSHFMAMLNKAPLVTKLDNDKNGISAYFQSLNIGVDNLNRIKHVVGSEISGRKYIDGFDEAIRINVGNNINHLKLIQVEEEVIDESSSVNDVDDVITSVIKLDNVVNPDDSFTFLTIDEDSETNLTMSDIELSLAETTFNDKSNSSLTNFESPIMTLPTVEEQYITNDARKLFNNIEKPSYSIPNSDSITAIQEKYKFMLDEEEMQILGYSTNTPLTLDPNPNPQQESNELIKFQSLSRGYLARFDIFVTQSMLKGNLPNITRFQSICRGFLLRKKLSKQNKRVEEIVLPSFQKDDEYGSSMTMRTILKNKAAYSQLQLHNDAIVKLQSIMRGQVQRRKLGSLRTALFANMSSTIKVQSSIRGSATRQYIKKNMTQPLQKTRVRKAPQKQSLFASPSKAMTPPYYDDDGLYERFDIPSSPSKVLPSVPQPGHVPRRSETKKQEAKYIPNLSLEPTTPPRSKSKSRNASKMHHSPTKTDFRRILSPGSPGSPVSLAPTVLFESYDNNKKDASLNEYSDILTDLASIIRGNLVRTNINRIHNELALHQNKILTIQNTLRGIETKLDYDILVEDIEEFDSAIIPLQSRIRGMLTRTKLAEREKWFLRPDNYRKICKLQAIIKGLHDVRDYRALIEERDPPFKAIKNFVSVIGTLEIEKANQKELKLIQLKQEIKNEKAKVGVELDKLGDLKKRVDILKKFSIDIKDLQNSLKKNVDSGNAVLRQLVDVDDIVEVEDRKRRSVKKDDSNQLSTFIGTFFWILQNKPEYWSNVLNYFEMTGDLIEFSSGNIEDWVLKSFNYSDSNSSSIAGSPKEEGLLAHLVIETFKLFIERTPEREFKSFVKKRRDFKNANIRNWELLIHAYLNLREERNMTKKLLGDVVFLITGEDDESFECEPENILTTLLENGSISSDYLEKYKTGEIDALDIPIVERVYIKNMQNLRSCTYEIFQTLRKSVDKLPLFLRVILREFHDILNENYNLSANYTLCLVGSVFIHCYVLPILNAPSNFSIDIEAISNDSNVISNIYRNLELVVICINQITTFKHFDPVTHPYLGSLNTFIDEIRDEMKDFIIALIDVPSVDVSYRKINLESDSLRTLKIQKSDAVELADILCSFMNENDNNEQDILQFCSKEIIQLEKSCPLETDSYGFIEVILDDDENNEENTNLLISDVLLLEVKKYLIYILQVQDGDNLIDMLVSEIQPADEMKFKEIVKSEKRLLKSEGIDFTENEIYKMSFPQMKKHTLELIFELERLQVISHQDGYQHLLNELAIDIKYKRKQQQELDNERDTVVEILTELKRRASTYKRTFDDYEKLIKLTLNNRLKQNLERKNKSNPKEESANIFHKLFSRSSRKMKKLKMKGSSAAVSDGVYGSHTMTVSSLIDKNVIGKATSVSRANVTIHCDKPGFFYLTVKGIETDDNSFNTTLDELLELVADGKSTITAFKGDVIFVSVGLLKLILNLYYSA